MLFRTASQPIYRRGASSGPVFFSAAPVGVLALATRNSNALYPFNAVSIRRMV